MNMEMNEFEKLRLIEKLESYNISQDIIQSYIDAKSGVNMTRCDTYEDYIKFINSEDE